MQCNGGSDDGIDIHRLERANQIGYMTNFSIPPIPPTEAVGLPVYSE